MWYSTGVINLSMFERLHVLFNVLSDLCITITSVRWSS